MFRRHFSVHRFTAMAGLLNRPISRAFSFVAATVLTTSVLFSQGWQRISPHFSTGDSAVDMGTALFLSESTGWLAYNTYDTANSRYRVYIMKTSDGGHNWVLNEGPNYFDPARTITAIDSLHLWILCLGGTLHRTTDGGATWDSLYPFPPDPDALFKPLHFFNTKDGVAASAYAYLTSDGGNTWTRGDTTARFMGPTDVSFPSRSQGWIVGAASRFALDVGHIAHSTDGGYSWTFQKRYPPVLYAVCFVDTLKGFAVGTDGVTGASGQLQRTTDGGVNWNGSLVLYTGPLYDVAFADSSRGWIASALGNILSTVDGGSTWNLETTGVHVPLRKINVLCKEGVIIVCGDGGTILKKGIVDKVAETRELPREFFLSQNYPNPFNPSTKISYSVSKQGLVTVRIFDVIGRELATLVDERKQAGTYTVEWNASGFSSGMYFYRIIAGEFVETKRMLLIR